MRLLRALVPVCTLLLAYGCGSSSSSTGTGGASSSSTGSTSSGSTSSTGASTSGGGAASSSTGSSTTSGSIPTNGEVFQAPEPWTKDVSGLSPDARSGAIIGALDSMGGWGGGNKLQIDFSFALLFADASTPRQMATGTPCGPDCDPLPLQMPVPANGNTEGSADYSCDAANNDCHVLVVATDEKKLYELYQATGSPAGLTAGGAFVWDLTKAYPDNERGDQCTSADAAGFPIAGLMTTADEVAAGAVSHALRFILPNDRMKAKVYVHPASHAGGPKSQNPDAPPYGVRFRLKASFDETPYNAAQKVVLKALKTYGMLLSDGGNIALTFSDDRLAKAKWADLGIDSHSFNSIRVTDFEVVDLGPEVPLTYDCVRNP